MGFLNELAKGAGALAGYYYGGPTGAAVGRFGAGKLTGEDTSNALENATYTGLGSYGLQSGLNYLGGTEFGQEYPWLSEVGKGGNMGNYFGVNLLGEGLAGDSAADLLLGEAGREAGSAATTGTSSGFRNSLPSLSSFGGGSNMVPMMIGTGLLSEAVTGPEKQRYQEDLNRNTLSSLGEYLNKATWNPETRTGYAKGLMGQYGDMIQGQQNRIGASGADAGRGGGFYSSRTERGARDAREAVAKALSKTYEPSTVSPSVFSEIAKASTAPLSAGTSFMSGLGDLAGKWPYLALMGQYGRA